ncbi:MAG: prephenate dehydratase domain-containing protein [Lysobacterales bacterium]
MHQYLLSRSGRLEDVERIFGHLQALAQTGRLDAYNICQGRKIPVSSNAEGARRARSADDAAAIAGETAAIVYGLKKSLA